MSHEQAEQIVQQVEQDEATIEINTEATLDAISKVLTLCESLTGALKVLKDSEGVVKVAQIKEELQDQLAEKDERIDELEDQMTRIGDEIRDAVSTLESIDTDPS